jgi:hypothetical protein
MQKDHMFPQQLGVRGCGRSHGSSKFKADQHRGPLKPNSELQRHNVFYRYFINHRYFFSLKILIFIFSSRRRQRRRQQYEIFQKILYETSFNIVNIYLSIISIQNNQTFQFIDNHHSTFTF